MFYGWDNWMDIHMLHTGWLGGWIDRQKYELVDDKWMDIWLYEFSKETQTEKKQTHIHNQTNCAVFNFQK